MPSDTVQIASALCSLVGVMFTGLLTYFMARLKADEELRSAAQKVHAETTAVKVDEIQQALGRIESNRANLALLKVALEEHGTALVANARDTASRLAGITTQDDLRDVLDHHGAAIIATTQATVAKLATIDDADART